MRNLIRNTADNSKTLYSIKYNEHYHSVLGAITESMHIFIQLGLGNFKNENISILEIGYGTGLNAMLSYINNKSSRNNIYYHGVDLYPPDTELIAELDYHNIIGLNQQELSGFCENWDEEFPIGDSFLLYKQKADFLKLKSEYKYQLVYFDAFSPEKQPDMWSLESLKNIYDLMTDNGIFVTYCCKGEVKRLLRETGFVVKRFQGPPGKRHVLKAVKM